MACSNGHRVCNCPPGPRGPQGLPGNTVSDTVSGVVSGHQIAVHTSVAGVVVNINETITSLVYAPATGDLTYTNEAGVANVISIPGSTVEDIQDAIGPFIAASGLLIYNDAGNAMTLPAGTVPGQVATVNATNTGIVYQTPSGSSVTITSPLGTVNVGGSTSAPTVDINAEGVQDIVGPFIAATGLFVYDDVGNALKLPTTATTGQVVTVNGAGTGLVFSTPASGVTSAAVQGLFGSVAACTAVPSTAFLLASDNNRYDASGVVAAASRKRLKTVSVSVNGAIASSVADVHVVTAGTAFSLTTPGACDPTDLWIKNTTTSALVISPSAGNIDGVSSYTIPAATITPNSRPAMHVVFDGTNWQVI